MIKYKTNNINREMDKYSKLNEYTINKDHEILMRNLMDSDLKYQMTKTGESEIAQILSSHNQIASRKNSTMQRMLYEGTNMHISS